MHEVVIKQHPNTRYVLMELVIDLPIGADTMENEMVVDRITVLHLVPNPTAEDPETMSDATPATARNRRSVSPRCS